VQKQRLGLSLTLLFLFKKMENTKQGNLIKLNFFLTYYGFSSWIVLFNIYLAQMLHLTGVQIASIIALQQFNSIWVVPLWGFMADKYGKKKMLVAALAGSATLLLGMYIPSEYSAMLAAMFALSLFYAPIGNLLDSVALEYLTHTHNTNYGSLRLWASLGWAMGSVVIGRLLSEHSLNYIFVIASLFLLTTSIITFLAMKPSAKANKSSVALSHLIAILKTHTRLRWYLLLLLLAGYVSSPTFLFVNMHYAEIHASYTQTGIAFMFQSLAELPVFYFSALLLRKFGNRNVLLFTLIVLALRLFCYGISVNPWFSIFVGISHGITFALMYVAIISLIQKYFPGELRASGQALVYSFYFGLGVVLGNLTIGYFKDYLTMAEAMKFMSLVCLVLISLIVLFTKSGYYSKL